MRKPSERHQDFRMRLSSYFQCFADFVENLTMHARRTDPFILLSYLYTALMRLAEIAEKGKTRTLTFPPQQGTMHYDEMKRAITELYNRQAGDERYDVVELF